VASIIYSDKANAERNFQNTYHGVPLIMELNQSGKLECGIGRHVSALKLPRIKAIALTMPHHIRKNSLYKIDTCTDFQFDFHLVSFLWGFQGSEWDPSECHVLSGIIVKRNPSLLMLW
jgi:hypothetical protein